MFDVLVFQHILEKEYKLGYSMEFCHEVQMALSDLDCDFDLFLKTVDATPTFWAWNIHKEALYIGVFKMYHDINHIFLEQSNRNLLWVHCLEKTQQEYTTVFFQVTQKDEILNKLKRINNLKAFL